MTRHQRRPLHRHLLDRHDREDGFTLIELVVVVIIIGLIAAIAIPAYLTVRNRAQAGTGPADLHNLVVANESYNTTSTGLHGISFAVNSTPYSFPDGTTFRPTRGTVVYEWQTIASDPPGYCIALLPLSNDNRYYWYDSTLGTYSHSANFNPGGACANVNAHGAG